MHEATIANQIIVEAKKHGEPKKIEIEVGDLAHLPASDLMRTLQNLVEWDIKIQRKKGIIKCHCGYQGSPKILEKGHNFTRMQCPECKNEDLDIIDGDQIVIKKVTVI